MKKYKASIVTLITALVMSVLAATIMFSPATASYADDRYVTVNGTSVFYTSVRGAKVTYDTETADGASHAYTMFEIGEDQTVTYRKNLAYSWKTGAEQDGQIVPEDRYFSMSLGFSSTAFERYIITFQSQQYVATEDSKTENFVIFTPAEDGLEVSVAQSLEEDADVQTVGTFSATAHISLSFVSFDEGTYTVEVSDGETTGTAQFLNVYKPYAKYVSSGDSAVTPLTFSAEFAEDADDGAVAEMKLYELNGQSFEMFDSEGGDNYTQVKDNQPPVMCFNSTPAYVEYGTSYSFDFVLIDVLASSPRSTSYFYVLSGDQYKAENFEYDATKSAETEEEEATLPKYTTVTSGSDARVIKDDNTFVPKDYLQDKEGNKVYGLVKIYYEIKDVSGSNAQTDNVFIDWYANEQSLVNVAELKGQPAANGQNFLKLIDGKNGVTYADDGVTTLDEYKARIEEIELDYQAKIDEAIEKLTDGKLYAGSSNKFYLPAFDYATDEYLYPTDLTYSIYYRAKTSASQTNLDSNNLSIPIKEPDVTYRFTIFVTDAFGNPMRYPEVNEEGVLEWKEISTSDIWSDEMADLLPYFEFEVSYRSATCEDLDNLSLAYVGTDYSGVSFDINGVSGTYSAAYKLYKFDRTAMYEDTKENYTYNEFASSVRELISSDETRKYFTTIKPLSELNENEAAYETMSAYEWNPDAVTFVPQSATGEFYVVELTLTDNRTQNRVYGYAAVAASVETTALEGENDWLENNLASVILLCVGGVCFIALIVLIVVKPKDKKDIDVVLDREAGKKGGKKS